MNDLTLSRAKELLNKGNLEGALRLCEEAIQNNQQNAVAYQTAAFIESDLGNYDKALSMSVKALEIDPNLVIPHVTRAYVLDMLGNKKESREEAKVALEKDPESPEVLCCSGTLLLQDGKIDEAKLHLEKAVRLRSSIYLAQYNLLTVYQKIKDVRKLTRQAVILFKLRPNVENFLRLTYIFSRSYQLMVFPALAVSIIVSLFVGAKIILFMTAALVTIDVLGGIFIGFSSRTKPLTQLFINLGMGLVIGLLGITLYFILKR